MSPDLPFSPSLISSRKRLDLLRFCLSPSFLWDQDEVLHLWQISWGRKDIFTSQLNVHFAGRESRLIFWQLEVKNNIVKFIEFHCTSVWNLEGVKEKQAEDSSYEFPSQDTELFYQCCDDRNLSQNITWPSWGKGWPGARNSLGPRWERDLLEEQGWTFTESVVINFVWCAAQCFQGG